MFDFEIQRCSRRCAQTQREFQPGDVYYSVLVPRGSQVVRLDYSEPAWEGPPDDAIGFWRARVPAPDSQRAQWAPNDVMLDYFERLAADPARSDVRFVLALLLLRRRILRLETTEQCEGQEVLVLHCPRKDSEYKVLQLEPEPQRVREIQEELARLLFDDAEGG
jgi:hypothetical protein